MTPNYTLPRLRQQLRYTDLSAEKWYKLCDHLESFGKTRVNAEGLQTDLYTWTTHGAVLETIAMEFYEQFRERYWQDAFLDRNAQRKGEQ